jgi:hypothetical protein
MTKNKLNPVALIAVVLGGATGAVLSLILVRRWRRGREAGFGDIPWRELVTLVGPIIALTRRLVEMTRRELIEFDRV